MNKIKAIISVIAQNNKPLILKARYKFMEKFDLNDMKEIKAKKVNRDEVEDFMRSNTINEFVRATSAIES
jgi:hypothetical protein